MFQKKMKLPLFTMLPLLGNECCGAVLYYSGSVLCGASSVKEIVSTFYNNIHQ
jgi:hypothetical protein